MKTLRQILYGVVIERLSLMYGHRTNTAKSLGISLKGLKNYINEIESKGITVIPSEHWEKTLDKIKALHSEMPTNEERLKFLNWKLNRER